MQHSYSGENDWAMACVKCYCIITSTTYCTIRTHKTLIRILTFLFVKLSHVLIWFFASLFRSVCRFLLIICGYYFQLCVYARDKHHLLVCLRCRQCDCFGLISDTLGTFKRQQQQQNSTDWVIDDERLSTHAYHTHT